jgi:DNA invertase Pin-like site-specific DNA recombinase
MVESATVMKKGRPKSKVALSSILELKSKGLGHKLIAKTLTDKGQFISASTVKRILKANKGENNAEFN